MEPSFSWRMSFAQAIASEVFSRSALKCSRSTRIPGQSGFFASARKFAMISFAAASSKTNSASAGASLMMPPTAYRPYAGKVWNQSAFVAGSSLTALHAAKMMS